MRLVYIGRSLQRTAKKERPDAQLACPLRRLPVYVPISAAVRAGWRWGRRLQRGPKFQVNDLLVSPDLARATGK